jgi:thiol:disulfide interchange protein DsbD
MNSRLVFFGCALAVAMPAFAATAAREHVRAELVAETTALVPGQRNWVGIRLVHDPHWHTYWINPGDSGLPTKLQWRLTPHLRAGDIAWPAPQRFEVGGLFNFGYSGDVVLPVPLEVDDEARTGIQARLTVEARWLVCREECIPGRATLRLALPIAAAAAPNARMRKAFATAHAAAPAASAWTGRARLAGDRIEVALDGANLPATDRLDAFAVQGQVVGNAPPQIVGRGDALVLSFARSEYLTATPATLDLVVVQRAAPGEHAWSVAVPFAADNTSATP